MSSNKYYYQLRIFQSASEKIAEGEYEVSNGGKLTIDIDEFGFLCHTVKFSARKQANDTLELEVLNNPIQNIELVQNESKSVNVYGRQPWKFTYVNKDSLRIEKGRNVSVTEEMKRKKCDIKINIDTDGKLVTVDKDTDTHSIKITTEKMPDENLKLSLNNEIIADLIPNEPKDFEILDNTLGCSLYFTGCYITTSESKYPKLEITQRPLEIPLTDAETTFVINPNGNGRLQMPTIHSIEFATNLTNEDGKNTLVLDDGKCNLSMMRSQLFNIFDEIVNRELYFSFLYNQRGNKHYIKVVQRPFGTHSETEYQIEKNGEKVLSIKIGKSGKLNVNEEFHFVEINVNKMNDTIRISNHGNEIELKCDSSQKRKKFDIWDEKLNRSITLSFEYTKIAKY